MRVTTALALCVAVSGCSGKIQWDASDPLPDGKQKSETQLGEGLSPSIRQTVILTAP